MSQNHLYLVAFVLLHSALLISAEPLVDDRFTSLDLEKRQLTRGEWKVAEGMASCTQDDALYAKYNNHGPVIWYKAPFADGTVKFSIKAEKTRNFVFTLNGETGHAFRIVMTAENMSVRVWEGESHDARNILPPSPQAPKLKDGEWITVELKFEGKKCHLKIGDFQQTLANEAIAKKKMVMGLGFAFGTLAVKDVSITTP